MRSRKIVSRFPLPLTFTVSRSGKEATLDNILITRRHRIVVASGSKSLEVSRVVKSGGIAPRSSLSSLKPVLSTSGLNSSRIFCSLSSETCRTIAINVTSAYGGRLTISRIASDGNCGLSSCLIAKASDKSTFGNRN
ncbi:hypothetical protein PPTG_24250 [Phytophthora nicotianae INRA-310]|uniref:Uncharacterized protein n=1 Tax=Phytophthora nicotianae (strain INRA-310) TaxID=761204 RepID=W2PIN6_PHYN3|nr:hypothetical protein PPTG_24250 [Phytophthora nicotianae INRA-310]ETN00506.1 hypothetical protein PPTG_24250 [Phytophthora nicotianae INRA-310]